MSNLPLLDEHLRTLHLPTMLANYRRVAQDGNDNITYLHALAALEVDRRHENGVRARIAAAHFPVVKTMESFDFSLQAQLPKAKLLDLLDGRFIAEHVNPILVGPTGVGKTHALTAIGLAACAAGYRTLFTTAAELCMNLIAAKREERLKRLAAPHCQDIFPATLSLTFLKQPFAVLHAGNPILSGNRPGPLRHSDR